MLKVSENPPLVWPGNQTLEEFVGQWWVAHTKSRNEKALAHDLIGRSVSYFLPMTWKVRHSRGRKIKSLLPLFSGYLFFCGNEQQRIEVLKTNRVASLINVKDQQQLVTELSAIERALQTGAALQRHKHIKAGQILVQQDDAVDRARLAQLEAEAQNMTNIEAGKASLAQKKVDLQKLERAASLNAATELEVEHAKLDVADRFELLIFAYRNHLADLPR